MDLWLTRNGAAGTKLLADALRRGPVACVYLPPGRLPLAGLVIDQQIEFVGDARTCLVGPIRIGAHGKVRLAGVMIEGDLLVEGAGVLHLIDAAVRGCVSLGGMSRTMIERSLLTVPPEAGIPALVATGRAEAQVSKCSISGGDVIATLGPNTRVEFGETVTTGTILKLDQNPFSRQPPPQLPY